MALVVTPQLTDIIRITDNGREVATCTGYEICDACGLARNGGVLVAQIMALNLQYLDWEVIGQVKEGTTMMSEQS